MSPWFLLAEMKAGAGVLLAIAAYLAFLCGRLAWDAVTDLREERRLP